MSLQIFSTTVSTRSGLSGRVTLKEIISWLIFLSQFLVITPAERHSAMPEIRFKSCFQPVRDSQWQESLTMVVAGNKFKMPFVSHPYHKNNSSLFVFALEQPTTRWHDHRMELVWDLKMILAGCLKTLQNGKYTFCHNSVFTVIDHDMQTRKKHLGKNLEKWVSG